MRRPLFLLPIAALVGVSLSPFPAVAAAVTATLPGGTPISVTIDSPADGALFPPGPVTVSGTASIGVGTPQRNTGLVYVLDVSGSTTTPNGCVVNSVSGDRLFCEKEATRLLNAGAAQSHTVAEVGLVVFGSVAASADFSNDGEHGTDQDVTNPEDPNFDQVLNSVRNTPAGGVGSFTDKPVQSSTVFSKAIDSAVVVAGHMSAQKKIVVFLSDGDDAEPLPDHFDDALNNIPAGIVFKTFAIGTAAQGAPVTCGPNAGDTLTRLAEHTHGGPCTEVKDFSTLLDVLPAVIKPQLTQLWLKVGDDDEQLITEVSPPLPVVSTETGASVTYRASTRALDPGPHLLCVRAVGDDSGAVNGEGTGSVRDCRTVNINRPPVVDAGGPYQGNEDNPVAIAGTVTDPDGPPATTSWSILPADGVPAGSVCTFNDPAALSTSVSCTERGTYRLTLTATDGLHDPVSSSTTLTLVNVPPVVSAGGPYSGNEDNQVPIVGTVTDPDGPPTTNTWSIVPASGVPPGSVCTFVDPAALSTSVSCTERGTYTLTLTATDGVNSPVSARTTLTLVNVAPTVSPGGPYNGNEDNQIPIVGTVTDPDGPPVTTTWSITPTDAPAVATCTFGNPAVLSTTVSCTDHGTYQLTLTATDGVNPPVSASTTLTLVNVVPVVSAGGPYPGEEDHPVSIAGTVVDPDSPGLTVNWTITPNLGTAICSFTDPTQLSTVVTCSEPGVYTLTLTVDDKVNPPVVATAVVSLSLTPGALSLISSVGPVPGFVGGDPVVVVQTVHNAGPAAMTGVRLTNTLPAGLTPTSVSVNGCATTCDLGTLAPGQTVEVRLSFAPTAPADLTVSAAVDTLGPDLDRGDNAGSVRLVVRAPILAVDPSAGPQGFVTHVTGRDFPAGARIRLQWSIGISETPGEVTVRPDGTLDGQALVFPKDTKGPRNLQAVSVAGPKFGMVTANPFLVFSPSLKPLSFVIR